MPLNHGDALCPVPRQSAAQCRARCPVAGIEQVESESEFRSPAISNWAYRKGRRGGVSGWIRTPLPSVLFSGASHSRLIRRFAGRRIAVDRVSTRVGICIGWIPIAKPITEPSDVIGLDPSQCQYPIAGSLDIGITQ